MASSEQKGALGQFIAEDMQDLKEVLRAHQRRGGRTTQNWHRLASGWHFFLPKMFFGLSMCFEQFQTFHFEKFPKIEIFVDWHRLASRLASGWGKLFSAKKKVFVTSFCSFALP